MHTFTQELSEAIRRLYPTFSKYRSSHVEGCPCCITDDDKRSLLSKRLDELTVDDVSRYSWKALTTWGNTGDFKHFLPRLFELMALDECSAIEPEVLLEKLRVGAWETWPTAEQESVAHYLDAIWLDCLTAEAGSVWVDELLCGIGHAVEDVRPFLRNWLGCRKKAGYAHLCHFVEWNLATMLKRRHLQNSFWADALQQMTQVADWLSSAQTVQGLEEVFNQAPDSDFSIELASAIDRISALQKALIINRTA